MRLIKKANSKENNFTILRFMAAFAVIISHNYALWGVTEPNIKGYSSLGGIGLYTFFIISGYLITKSYLNNPSIIHFFWKRILRIFPALIPIFLITVFIIGPVVTTFSFREYFHNPMLWEYLKGIFLYPIKYNLPGVFLSNPYPITVNGSLWTLPIEFFLYICIGIIGIVGLIYKRYFAPLVLLIMIFSDFFFNIPEYQGIIIFSSIPVYQGLKLSIYFLTGSFFYLFCEKIKLNSKFAILLSFVFILSIGTPYVFILSYLVLPYLIIYLVFGIENAHLRNFGKWGDFSYGLYIYAFPIQQTLVYFFKSHMTFLIFSISVSIITFVLAFLSWHLIEKKALKIKV